MHYETDKELMGKGLTHEAGFLISKLAAQAILQRVDSLFTGSLTTGVLRCDSSTSHVLLCDVIRVSSKSTAYWCTGMLCTRRGTGVHLEGVDRRGERQGA